MNPKTATVGYAAKPFPGRPDASMLPVTATVTATFGELK
jgi:hypothetical protein